ncbi:MAG: AIPR family protein [Eubacteriales bacterium]|nr:AIPR family protein [Eubacteriales bacterium]
MSDFRKQIQEDFVDYREHYPNVENINKDEWSFNFWVLDKLFSIDEDVIEENIIDYDDKGIDCFVWHEDLHDLYLIQNKYYSDSTTLSNSYIQNDFLTRAIGALEKGTYTRSKTLQDIYNKFHLEDDFSIHFYLYVTNNISKSKVVTDGIASFNEKYASKHFDAKIFSLDEIEELYYNEPLKDKKSFKYTIKTINKGTILNVDNSAYKMTLALDAKYVLAPVTVIHEMYKQAEKQKYPLFDENIREYLGSTGAVNKKIVATLKDRDDRKNFFFYNNGITMIVSDMSSDKMAGTMREFEVSNPQIVNGCQTVSTIHETLSSLPEATLEKEFENTYVMVKILKIPSNDDSLKELYRNIVTYNNSQNSINEKTFTAVQDVFRHIQAEFEWRGFLVCIKQSDKNTFSTKYKTATSLLNNNSKALQKFGLTSHTKTKDFMIDLEKLLQVFLAFVSTPQDAIQNKSKLLKDQSIQNQKVVDFIKNTDSTSNDLFNIFMLYTRAEQEKKNNPDGKIPNPFYLVYCFANYECNNDASQISKLLNSPEAINGIIKKYTLVIKLYHKKWVEKNPGHEYNDMIKAAVDLPLLKQCKSDAEDMLSLFSN